MCQGEGSYPSMGRPRQGALPTICHSIPRRTSIVVGDGIEVVASTAGWIALSAGGRQDSQADGSGCS